MEKLLNSVESINLLANKLQRFEFVRKFDSENEPEGSRLANSLSDLEQSFVEILENFLPLVCSSSNEEEIKNALLDIGEELRHILYHIKDPKFFSYLIDED